MATGPWGGPGDTRVFRVNLVFTKALQKCQTGFHIRDVGINTLDPQEVADDVAGWAEVHFINTLHLNDRLIAVDVTNLATKEGAAHEFNNLAGVQPGEEAPSFITVPVSIKGSIRRRYGNGRMLWPVGSEAGMAVNTLAAPMILSYQNALTALYGRYGTGGILATMRLVHLHDAMPAHGTRPAIPATWYDVTSLRLNTSLSSLRRRKVGVGS